MAQVRAVEVGRAASARQRVDLSVVVPVYNQRRRIVDNVRTIRQRIADRFDGSFEVVVVSDGSVDRTDEALLEGKLDAVRVFSYDRNLGKGYAIKAGALAARGDWIAYVDADLDLDPAAVPSFVDVARREGLDFAIGSKRHPESRVHYPRSRRVASWLYQQLGRVLFQLNVRDTQVGLKVFRRAVAEDVLPLLLVKRFAFDLELLAVANRLGFRRVRELPIVLDYQFTGSGVGSVAVLRALIDTAAVFYRLRVLRYYDRKRALLGGERFRRSLDYRPLVSLVAVGDAPLAGLDYERLEVLTIPADTPSARAEAARRARGEVVAFLGARSKPAGNWIASAVPFLARDEIAAVVCPSVAPHHGSVLHRAAAAVAESRLGGGSSYFRSTPGNLRVVRDFRSQSIVVRGDDLAGLLGSGAVPDDLCDRFAEAGKLTVYTPETVIVRPKEPLFRAHLHGVSWYARRRGDALRSYGWRSLRPSTTLLFAGVGLLALAAAGIIVGGPWRATGGALWTAYGLALAVAGAAAAFRFRSPLVGALAAVGLLATHVVYAATFTRALLAPTDAYPHPELARRP